jgi:hypothetical protein
MPYASKPKVSAVKASGSSSGNSKMTSQLKAAQKALEQSYKPTGEETAAENAVNDLATQSIASVNKIKAEPIAQGFQTGQIRETERRSEEKAVPLKLQIATLQARRQASSNLASSKLQYAKDMIAQSQKSTSTSLSQDEEYKQLQKDKLKASIAKTNKPKATESTTNDWQKVTMEKGPTGRVRSIIERNKKTGETRRVNVK